MTTKITGANVNTLSLGVVGGVVQTTLAAAQGKVQILLCLFRDREAPVSSLFLTQRHIEPQQPQDRQR
jgi:hypothetical protein